MAPILGIWASQISGHLWAPSGAYDSIASTTVGAGGASSVDFTSIPSTYTHLQIRAISRTSSVGATHSSPMTFNNDSGSNYVAHYLYGDGATTGAGAATSQTSIPYFYSAGTTSGTNVFHSNVVDILDYANTNKNKTVRIMAASDMNGSGFVQYSSGLWLNTSAINRITITGAFVQYTQIALYGIKGA